MNKYKFLLVACSIFTLTTQAQKVYLGQLPKPGASRTITGVPEAPTTNIFGPVANLASYSVTDKAILSGAGFGYKHMRFNDGTKEWNEIWSINGLGWYKAPITGDPNDHTAFAYGIAAGASLGLISPKLQSPFNILAGIATTNIKEAKNLFGTLGVTLAINR